MTIMPVSSSDRPEAPLFCDGIGERVVAADGATGELLQILRIRPALTAVPSFEFALRERTARLANFRHAYYGRVRRVDRVQVPAPGLSVVSDHVEGTRLSDILRVAQETRLQLDVNAALCLIRQLVPAVALLHENARDVAHGLIAPERLIVTPHARLVIVEHVLAGAIEQLQFSRERLWQEFRIAMPPSAGMSRFDHRADVTGVGLVALALLLGRPLAAEEFPHRLPLLLNEARERTALGEEQPLSQPLRDWLARSMQLDSRRAFASAPEALAALEELVADDSMYVAAPVALETFLSRYITAVLEPPPMPQPPAAPTASIPYSPDVPVAPAAPPASRPLSPPARPAPKPGSQVTQPQTRPASPLQAPVGSRAPAASAASSGSARAAASEPVVSEPFASETQLGSEPKYAAEPKFAAERALPKLAAADIADLIQVADLAPADVDDDRRGLFDADNPFTMPPLEPAAASVSSKRRSIPRKAILAAVALAIVAAAGFAGPRLFQTTVATPTPQMGTLIVQSNPSGVQVFVDGVDRGPTPASVSVTPGAHILELRGRGVPRVIPFNAAAGAQVSHYVEFANTPETGQLRVESQPAGAKVVVDGVERGVAPTLIENLTPGDHEVILRTTDASARHVVTVQAGGIASLVAPVGTAPALPGSARVSGWITVKAPFAIEIREDGRVIGTSDADRVMLMAGRHEIQLVNDGLGFTARKVVTVQPGKVTTITTDLPNGVVNLNAAPWAEVWIDGQRVGETPIGNLSVPIGPHEVVFRNPQYGEKRHAISVGLSNPVRLSVDMKQEP